MNCSYNCKFSYECEFNPAYKYECFGRNIGKISLCVQSDHQKSVADVVTSINSVTNMNFDFIYKCKCSDTSGNFIVNIQNKPWRCS